MSKPRKTIRDNPNDFDHMEAEEHQAAFMAWRHAPHSPQLGSGRLLPQDLGYFADEREHCPHCREASTQKEAKGLIKTRTNGQGIVEIDVIHAMAEVDFNERMSQLAETDPHHVMELRFMHAQRQQQREAYVQKLKAMSPEERETERRKTAELLARSPFRRAKLAAKEGK